MTLVTPPDDLTIDATRVPPILRWAGGKRWLVPRLTNLVARETFNRYYEPFLGGAAVFLGLPQWQHAVLSDSNDELIAVYRALASSPKPIHESYSAWPNDRETYYLLRDESFTDEVQRAARFIYLNHHSFNGIYRVNLRGEYNVPFGARTSPRMPSIEHLQLASRKFRTASLQSGDFGGALDDVAQGDLVFLDPPYVTKDNSEAFAKYTRQVYSYSDQERLAIMIDEILSRNASFILTNAAHSSISKLFRRHGRMIRVTRRNSIGGKEAARGQADEYLFTNIKMPKGGLK